MTSAERIRRGLPAAALLACASDASLDTTAPVEASQPARRAETEALATWNVITLRTTAAGAFSPPRETRAVAMVSAAVFDAVNSISRRFDPYLVRVAARTEASTEAAVGAATHGVLVALYPTAAASLDASLDSALAALPAGRARDEGVTVGRTVAAAVLAARARDRASEAASYTPGTGLGAWVPTPPAFRAALEAGWGSVAPFVLDSASQFRPGPPPTPGTESYLRDYREIVGLGAASSAARTATQTEAARFWVTTAPHPWNAVVRQLVAARGVDASTAARVYLLVNLAGADAFIASWDAKFAYAQWRPVTAIRYAGADRGLTIAPDTAWTPLLATPPFPDYPAGHTAYAGAAEEVLAALFGDRPAELAISSPSAGGATRRYASVRDLSTEVVDARVWGGVHWRTSSTAGREMGRRIGAFVVERGPKPGR